VTYAQDEVEDLH